MNAENHLGLFTKYWTPGKVKTRLAASVGNDLASRIHFELLNHIVKQYQSTADQRWLVFDPLSHQKDFERLGKDRWNVCAQSSGHLGQRMRDFFRQRFGDGTDSDQTPVARKVVVIGADCPQLDNAQIETAFESLEDVRVVIGPSVDGGYYLIGISQTNRLAQLDQELLLDLFDGIDWGTSRVLSQTLAVLKKWQVEFELLPEMNDVDDVGDLSGLLNSLRARVVNATAKEAEIQLLERLEAVLADEDADSKLVCQSGDDA